MDLADKAAYIDGTLTPSSKAALIVQTPVPFCPIWLSTSSIKYLNEFQLINFKETIV